MTLVNGATVALTFLVELFPFDLAAGVVSPFYLSTIAYVTGPADRPANIAYDPVVTNALQQTNHLFVPGAVTGKSDASRGAIQIDNPSDQPGFTGRYDGWKSLAWSGRRVRVLVGQSDAAYASFSVILDGAISGQPTINRDDIAIPVSNNLDRLNLRLQPTLYAGTGDAEGDGTLAGKCKPRGFGVAREVPAPMIPGTTIYQVNDGPVAAILAAYERGAVIAAGPAADYPSYAALAGATLAVGSYATCLAGGYVRIASTPAGPVTFDVQFTVASSVARIAEALMAGCYGFAPGVNYDPASIAALDALQPAIAGYWSGIDGVTGLTALDTILGGAGCWYTATRTGLVTVGRIDPPTLIGPADPACALVLGAADVADQGISLATGQDPVAAAVVSYAKFYQTQTSGYATSLSPERIADLAQTSRTAAYTNPVAASWPFGQTIRPDSPFDGHADAANEAVRLVGVSTGAGNLPRETYTVEAFTDPFAIALGAQIWLAHPRYQLGAGKGFRVIGMEEDARAQTVTLTLWG